MQINVQSLSGPLRDMLLEFRSWSADEQLAEARDFIVKRFCADEHPERLAALVEAAAKQVHVSDPAEDDPFELWFLASVTIYDLQKTIYDLTLYLSDIPRSDFSDTLAEKIQAFEEDADYMMALL